MNITNMPKKVHDKLAKEAKKKGLTGSKFNKYVFGVLNKLKGKSK